MRKIKHFPFLLKKITVDRKTKNKDTKKKFNELLRINLNCFNRICLVEIHDLEKSRTSKSFHIQTTKR